MAWVDLVILAVLLVATLGGLAQGFFRTVCSLGGLVAGLLLASWNYGRVADVIIPLVRIDAVADALGFLVIALAVMAIANMAGAILTRTVDWMGLGCLDKLGGAVLGFVQGALLVMVCILVTVAFFPDEHWLAEARLPQMFFGACHVSTHMTPGELADRVHKGMRTLEHESARWMHSHSGAS